MNLEMADPNTNHQDAATATLQRAVQQKVSES